MQYAGIGSRKTPEDILLLMTNIAKFLCTNKYLLRSGGADGADKAFEAGVFDNSLKEIYLPWKGFNGNPSEHYRVTDKALLLASRYHPAWDKLSYGSRKLMGRNCYQVLGFDLGKPVDFVICWTPGGREVGGTALAMRIARAEGISVFNLFRYDDRCLISSWISNDKIELSA